MIVDGLQISLLIHEQKFKRVTHEDEGQALKAKGSRKRGRSDKKWKIMDEDGQSFKIESSRGRGRGSFRGG